jgi:hypothetical protein
MCQVLFSKDGKDKTLNTSCYYCIKPRNYISYYDILFPADTVSSPKTDFKSHRFEADFYPSSIPFPFTSLILNNNFGSFFFTTVNIDINRFPNLILNILF